ncbi:MAG TPA: hypothetical protein PK747_05410 [Acidobacteriota bacterium]|nr:hypothetical protein [Acidobacteriota bacterium]HNT16935.1 hypothetical protein [Acidobacteriota bacterium]HQO20317.1 hypothetical protein [Acidobacteriota bacterium]HQQ46832.1 hypothetical protein [Acidobacteriota bacterium]
MNKVKDLQKLVHRHIVLLMLVNIISLGIYSGDNRWTLIGPNGGDISQIVVNGSSPEIIYALARQNYFVPDSRIYKSVDSGNSYQDITFQLIPLFNDQDVYIFQIDNSATNPNILYVATSIGIFKTEDGGDSYISCDLRDMCITCLTIDPQNINVIFAGTKENGLFKSSDGGNIWTSVNHGINSTQINCITVDPINNKKIYACTAPATIYESIDGGMTWIELSSIINPSRLVINPIETNILYILAGEYGLSPYKSIDGGLTWSYIEVGWPFVSTLIVSSDAPARIYAGTPNGICTSIDSGNHWECKGDMFPNNRDVASFALDPHNTSVLYAGTSGGGIFKSADGGDSWVKSDKGLEASFTWKVALDPSNDHIIYAGTNGGGLYKSENNGLDWQMKNQADAGVAVWNIFDMAFDPTNPSTMYIGSGCCKGMFKTEDSGNTWQELGTFSFVETLAIDPLNSSTLYANGSKSLDGGNTWFSSCPETIGKINKIAIDPTRPSNIYLITSNSEIFRSNDGGLSWARKDIPIPNSAKDNYHCTVALDSQTPDTIYAGLKGIYQSEDGGNTWVCKGLEEDCILEILVDPGNPDVVFAGSLRNGVYRSNNRGDTWESFSDGMNSSTVLSLAIIQQPTWTIYAGTTIGIFSYAENHPVINSIRKLSNPFRLKIIGGNINPDVKVYIGTSQIQWTNIKYKSPNEIVLKGGVTLKNLIPKGVPVEIKVVNGDGGSATYIYTR